MTNGFNASNAGFHRFNTIYQYIRQAYLFLDNAKPIGVASDQEKLTEDDINRMKSEAKFLIAYSYFSLFDYNSFRASDPESAVYPDDILKKAHLPLQSWKSRKRYGAGFLHRESRKYESYGKIR